MGWTTPWTSQRIVEFYRDVIALAPLSKMMIGSGGHGSPEVSWLAAKTAKIAVGEVLTDAVRRGLMAERDAERAGRMILHDNAARMYGLNRNGRTFQRLATASRGFQKGRRRKRRFHGRTDQAEEPGGTYRRGPGAEDHLPDAQAGAADHRGGALQDLRGQPLPGAGGIPDPGEPGIRRPRTPEGDLRRQDHPAGGGGHLPHPRQPRRPRHSLWPSRSGRPSSEEAQKNARADDPGRGEGKRHDLSKPEPEIPRADHHRLRQPAPDPADRQLRQADHALPPGRHERSGLDDQLNEASHGNRRRRRGGRCRGGRADPEGVDSRPD